MNELVKNLVTLNSKLDSLNIEIDLHLIGGMALHLHGIDIGRKTQDWDNVNKIDNENVIKEIHEIADDVGMECWFDFGAESIPVQADYKDRLVEYRDLNLSNIKLFLLSLEDLIELKVASYYDRSTKGIVRDLEDLKRLKPSLEQVEKGIEFTFSSRSKDLADKFKEEFKKELVKIKKEICDALGLK